MKKFLLGAAAFLALPLSLQAGELLPHTFARVYCQSRAMGMSNDAAVTQAVDESYISSGNPMTVTINGTQTTTDVVAAFREARLRCPEYI